MKCILNLCYAVTELLHIHAYNQGQGQVGIRIMVNFETCNLRVTCCDLTLTLTLTLTLIRPAILGVDPATICTKPSNLVKPSPNLID